MYLCTYLLSTSISCRPTTKCQRRFLSLSRQTLFTYLRLKYNAGLSQAGGPGGLLPPHFLSDQLTLSQPGGQIIPTIVLRAPPEFQTLRRACYMIS